MKRLVLLGGGHAHVHVLKAIGDAPDPGIGVTLISPVDVQVYSGMLPGYVAGHYRLEECGVDLRPLAARALAVVVRSPGTLVDARRREVHCADGTVVPYDVLSIDIGSRPFVGTVEGVTRHAIPVRPLESFAHAWERVLMRAREGGLASVTVVGAGAAGIELAFAIDHRFRTACGEGAPHVRLLTSQPVILPEYGEGVRARLHRLARRRNIGIHPNGAVAEVGEDFVRLKENIRFASDATFWVAGPAAPSLVADSGLGADDRGFLAVNDCLQAIDDPAIFGAGDCATSVGNPRPKAGVFAVRAGPALAANLLAALRGEPLRPHVTRKRFLALISCGDRRAIGVYGPLVVEGRWVWRWKDRIDRRFLAQYAVAGG